MAKTKQTKKKLPVILSVTGKSQGQDEDTEDSLRMVTTGTLTGGGDEWQLTYEETEPDNKETQLITLSLAQGKVTMQRDGTFSTSMVFEKGCRFEGCYNTPYGALDMGLYATHVRYSVDKGQGEIFLKYQLDLQGQYSSMHELRVQFAPNGPA